MRLLPSCVLIIAACGGDPVKKLPDGPPGPDAAVDGDNGAVTLTITLDGAPQESITTFFLNADSSVVSATTTNTAGVASAMMASGGYVVAINPWGMIAGKGSNDIRIFAGVKSGDHLVLPHSDAQQTAVTFSLSFVLDPNAAASRYALWTSCGNSSGLTGDGDNITLYDCNGVADMMIVVYDVNNNVVDSFYHPAVAVTDGGTVMLTDSYAAVGNTTFNYTNGTGVLGNLNVNSGQSTNRGIMFEQSTFPALTNGTASFTQKRPPATGAFVFTVTQFNFTQSGHQTVIDTGPQSSTYAMDLGAVALPSYTTYPTFDVATATMSFPTSGGGAQPDLYVASAYDTTTGQGFYTTMVGPYTAGTAKFPTLPLDGTTDWNFHTADNAGFNDMLLAKVPGGYDAVRANAHALLTGNPNFGALAGTSGHVVVEKSGLSGNVAPACVTLSTAPRL